MIRFIKKYLFPTKIKILNDDELAKERMILRRQELGLKEKKLTSKEISSGCFFIPVFKIERKKIENKSKPE